MVHPLFRMTFATLLGAATLALPAAGDDAKAPQSAKPSDAPKSSSVDKSKAPDFSGYASVAKVIGEIVKADDNNMTLRIYWEKVTVKNNNGRNNGSRSRPGLSSGRTQMNPSMTRRPQVQVKWEHHDYTIPFLPESLVRVKHLPPKVDAGGKKGFYSQAEQDELKVPYSVPGYQASKSDLTPGTVVEVYVVRDKAVPAGKTTEDDLRVKYAVIVGHDANPPKSTDPTSNNNKKKQ